MYRTHTKCDKAVSMTGEATPYLMPKKIPTWDPENRPVPDYLPAIPKPFIGPEEIKKMKAKGIRAPMHIGRIPKPYGRQSSIPGNEVIFVTDEKHKEPYQDTTTYN